MIEANNQENGKIYHKCKRCGHKLNNIDSQRVGYGRDCYIKHLEEENKYIDIIDEVSFLKLGFTAIKHFRKENDSLKIVIQQLSKSFDGLLSRFENEIGIIKEDINNIPIIQEDSIQNIRHGSGIRTQEEILPIRNKNSGQSRKSLTKEQVGMRNVLREMNTIFKKIAMLTKDENGESKVVDPKQILALINNQGLAPINEIQSIDANELVLI